MKVDLGVLPEWEWLNRTVVVTPFIETDQKQTFTHGSVELETSFKIVLTPELTEANGGRNVTPELNRALLSAKDRIAKNFNSSHWQDVGLLTNSTDIVNGHGRLMRSLSFGDDDYEGNIVDVLVSIVGRDVDNLQRIQEYLDEKFGDGSTYISDSPSEMRITFAPPVFRVPDVEQQSNLVAVMMPFAGFDAVHSAITDACEDASLVCRRADDIWDDSTFIQDIVNLIFAARVVVCDFSTRNPNVFYETGIAHTLGKAVVPITQNLSDIPSDLTHHRVLRYLNNTEGLQKLCKELKVRLQTIVSR